MASRLQLLIIGLLVLVVAATFQLRLPVKFHGSHIVEQRHFVLVHGLGHGGWCWYKITTLLQEAGHRVTAIDLTSNGNSKVVADTVTSLAHYLQPLTEFLANELHPSDKVILVGHSLGGSSITYAMELFSTKIDKAIFVAAFMPSNNQSFLRGDILQVMGTFIEQGIFILNFANGASNPATSLAINLTLAKDYFYNDSPLQDVNLAKALLNPTPYPLLEEVLILTPSKYGNIKRFYIKTPNDRIVVPSLQASIIEQNPPYKELIIPNSDHSPFFSKPIALRNLLLSIAAS